MTAHIDPAEFVRTRTYCHVSNLPDWIDREVLPPETVGCYLYAGGWIADCGTHWYTPIETEELVDSDLSRLEESLYTYLYL